MSLIDKMKERIKNSGTNKKEVLYFAPDSKKRIRFLQELDEGKEFTFHSNYTRGINALCAETYGKGCALCSDEDLTTVTNYAFSVYDYDSSSVKILLFKATGITPIPAFIEFFENYGTITDRDYIVKKVGKGTGGSFVVTPCDKERFKNSKAKPFGENTLIKILAKAFPPPADIDLDDDDDDDEDETPKKSKKKESKKSKKKEPTLREKFEELDEEQLKEIGLSLGMSKKEIRNIEDEEEFVEILFDDYEEEDLEDVYEEVMNDEPEEEDEDDE